MSAVSREQLRALMGEVLAAQGKTLPDDDAALLSDIGFRSLDFSELALRVDLALPIRQLPWRCGLSGAHVLAAIDLRVQRQSGGTSPKRALRRSEIVAHWYSTSVLHPGHRVSNP